MQITPITSGYSRRLKSSQHNDGSRKINTANCKAKYSSLPTGSVCSLNRYNKQSKFNSDALNKSNVAFGSNPLNIFKEAKNLYRYLKAQHVANAIYLYTKKTGENNILRAYAMEPLEGLQYGIKVFKNLTMKEIQYLSENLHVIAVKRGCKNMCAHCYADAKPQKREMSWEDFTLITRGFKKLKKRLHNLDLYGENNPIAKNDLIYRTTELFYDSDCMELVIKDKNGVLYDFTQLATELYESLGRRTAFDTSGWNRNNPVLQQRAEKYAQYFTRKENMEKLNAFNVSFNVFNASYVASRKALKNGDYEKAKRLKERYTDNIANAVYTFTPLIDNPKFHILSRCFDSKAKNAKDFDKKALASLAQNVLDKLALLYKQDLESSKKYVKDEEHLQYLMANAFMKINSLDTELNSSGRMKKFMQEFSIKAPLMEYDESLKKVKEDLVQNERFHRYIMLRMIDADGKVYHMNYARFFPTEIQLNIPGKNLASPELANLDKEFVISKEMLNRPEFKIIKN